MSETGKENTSYQSPICEINSRTGSQKKTGGENPCYTTPAQVIAAKQEEKKE